MGLRVVSYIPREINEAVHPWGNHSSQTHMTNSRTQTFSGAKAVLLDTRVFHNPV